MKSGSVVVRSMVFHVAVAVALVAFVPVMPLLLVPDRRASKPAIFAFLRLVSWLLRVVTRIDFRVEGRENLPAAPYLIASRHESAWEVLLFPLLFDDPVAFAKQEIFAYPLGGLIARRGGHIAIDRGGDLAGLKAGFEAAKRAVAGGRSLLIFPSGTRHPDGRDRILSGVAALYDLLGVPCVPVHLDSGACWPPGSWLKFPGTIHVRIGPPIPAGIGRGTFARELGNAMRALAPTPDEATDDGGAAISTQPQMEPKSL